MLHDIFISAHKVGILKSEMTIHVNILKTKVFLFAPSKVCFQVINSKVIVHAVAITDQADTILDKFAHNTGGLSYLYLPSVDTHSMSEAFRKIGAAAESSCEFSSIRASIER